MLGFAKCTYKDCPNLATCNRYINAIGAIMDYKSVCNKDNNYEMYSKIETNIQEQEKKEGDK